MSKTFIDDQHQISKLCQQVLEVERTLSTMRDEHYRAVTQLKQEVEKKYSEKRREIAQLNKEMKSLRTSKQSTLKEEYKAKTIKIREQYEQQLADANAIVQSVLEANERLQKQIDIQSLQPASPQVPVKHTSDPVLGNYVWSQKKIIIVIIFVLCCKRPWQTN